VRFEYFSDRAGLLGGNAQRTFDAPRTAAFNAPCEGTPNIYRVTLSPDIDHSEILCGFHFYENGDVDRVASGRLTDFAVWEAQERTSYNDALAALGVAGNMGDRDHIVFGNARYNVQEGQLFKDDWGAWRSWLYEFADDAFVQLDIRTHGGSSAFGNPTVTRLRSPAGVDALVMTQFLFSEGAAPGEAGSLVFYRELEPMTGDDDDAGDDDTEIADDDAFWDDDDASPAEWVFEAETDLEHGIGYLDGDGWAAATASDVEGHMCYGPYTTDIPGGGHSARFRLMIDDNSADALPVVTVDVYDVDAGEILAIREILRTEFSATHTYQDLTLPFDNTTGHSLEFRTYWHDVAWVKQDHVAVE